MEGRQHHSGGCAEGRGTFHLKTGKGTVSHVGRAGDLLVLLRLVLPELE
jgi:hypothetical protein